jgi:dTDP-3,4-didehydro-2,6-dideoxy-alpha-D-glucose 3-reductase
MIRIGIIGCAEIAKKFMISNMRDSGRFFVEGVASRDFEKARLYSSQFSIQPIDGYEELVNSCNIDAVYIPLPTGLHYEWIMKSLNNNKHVFCEKSLTDSYDKTKEIISLAKKKKLCVFENFMFPFHSQIDFVNEKINQNEIGSIRLLRSTFGFPIFKKETNIRYKKEIGGGALLDAGAYTLKAAQIFLGYNQSVISSDLEYAGNQVDFFGSVILKNSDGVVSQLAFGFDNFYQNSIELWGSKGKITLERAFTSGPGFSPKVVIERHGEKSEYLLPPDNHFIKILKCFADSIENNNYDFQFEQILNQSKLISQVQKKCLTKY